jgi:hypothetical protein
MGRIVREEYVCDMCGKPIDEDVLIGRLSLRKTGVRGLGRTFKVVLHDTCSEKLTPDTARASAQRKAASKA